MLSSAPVLGAAGQVGGVVAQLDITDRIHAEKALRERQQLLQSTMDNFPALIAYKDVDGRFLDGNHEALSAIGRLHFMPATGSFQCASISDASMPGSKCCPM